MRGHQKPTSTKPNVAAIVWLVIIASLLALVWGGYRKWGVRAKSEMNPLLGIGDVKKVASGFISTEGPVWHRKSNSLLFSDIPGNTIYRLDMGSGKVSKVRSPSNTANGLALDHEGYLLAAEQESRTITRMDLSSGVVSPLIARFRHNGSLRAFNSPNDMAIHPKGGIYFTDPPYGLRGRKRELDFNGVFLRKPNGTIKLLKRLNVGKNPNGIIFSSDHSVLFLAISDNKSGPLLAYDVDKNGGLSNEREFARAQNADGMAIDALDNLYVATRTGVRVWSKTGREWGWIRLPGDIRTTNVAFGGKNMDTLFITNRSKDLYAVQLKAGLSTTQP